MSKVDSSEQICNSCSLKTVKCSNCKTEVHCPDINYEESCYLRCKDVRKCTLCLQNKLLIEFSSSVNRVCNSCRANEEVKEKGKKNLSSNLCKNCNCTKKDDSKNYQIACRCDLLCFVCLKPLGKDGKELSCKHWVCKICIIPIMNFPNNSIKSTDKECAKCQKVFYCKNHKKLTSYNEYTDTKFIKCCKVNACLKCYKHKAANHVCSSTS